MVKELNTEICAFCGKEPTSIKVTGMGYPMGEKCYKKANKKGVNWDEKTKLKVLKHELRFGSATAASPQS